MKKEIFEKIQTRLEARIAKCYLYLWQIETTDDLKGLTIEQAQALLKFCREEEAVMTKFVQCDLYHLIGMGDLTPPQMTKLTYLTRDWLKYRGALKTISMNFDKISQLPSLPVSAVYRLRAWSDITLSTTGALANTAGGAEAPYAISGNLVMVLPERLAEFLEFWSLKAKTNFSENNFQQKLVAGVEYGGVRWTIDNAGNYVGVIKQDNIRQLFEGCAKAAQENIS